MEIGMSYLIAVFYTTVTASDGKQYVVIKQRFEKDYKAQALCTAALERFWVEWEKTRNRLASDGMIIKCTFPPHWKAT